MWYDGDGDSDDDSDSDSDGERKATRPGGRRNGRVKGSDESIRSPLCCSTRVVRPRQSTPGPRHKTRSGHGAAAHRAEQRDGN